MLRKIFLSPGMPAACRSCGRPVVVTYRYWLKAAWPGAAIMVLAMFLESNLLIYTVSTAGFVLMIWMHLRMVPLVAPQREDVPERLGR